MGLKLKLSPQLKDKFEDELAKQIGEIGEQVWSVNIKYQGTQYEFTFKMHGSDWRMELDKNPNDEGLYILHCSTRELRLSIQCIKDLKVFCQQIVRIRHMQCDYLDTKNK